MLHPLLPWHEAHWQRLYPRVTAHTLAHALLLSGPAGMGKRQFAGRLSQAILCTAITPAGACGLCASCQALQAGVHPDYRQLAREADSKVIKIDQIRDLTGFMALTAQFNGARVAVIHQADCLNKAAANSLLKTLEEPGPESILILVAEQPADLPATIRSRCQQWFFMPPPREQAFHWLQQQGIPQPDLYLALAGGVPLRAQALAQEPMVQRRRELLQDLQQMAANPWTDRVKLAAKWQEAGIAACLEWLSSLVMELIRYQLAGLVTTHLDLAAEIAALAQGKDVQARYGYLAQLRRAADLTSTAANPELLLESVFLAWPG